jgi:hypothetical protein
MGAAGCTSRRHSSAAARAPTPWRARRACAGRAQAALPAPIGGASVQINSRHIPKTSPAVAIGPGRRHPVKAGASRAPASRLAALTRRRRPGRGLPSRRSKSDAHVRPSQRFIDGWVVTLWISTCCRCISSGRRRMRNSLARLPTKSSGYIGRMDWIEPSGLCARTRASLLASRATFRSHRPSRYMSVSERRHGSGRQGDTSVPPHEGTRENGVGYLQAPSNSDASPGRAIAIAPTPPNRP